jgi:hypothetical protein
MRMANERLTEIQLTSLQRCDLGVGRTRARAVLPWEREA